MLKLHCVYRYALFFFFFWKRLDRSVASFHVAGKQQTRLSLQWTTKYRYCNTSYSLFVFLVPSNAAFSLCVLMVKNSSLKIYVTQVIIMHLPYTKVSMYSASYLRWMDQSPLMLEFLNYDQTHSVWFCCMFMYKCKSRGRLISS